MVSKNIYHLRKLTNTLPQSPELKTAQRVFGEFCNERRWKEKLETWKITEGKLLEIKEFKKSKSLTLSCFLP
jgi:hypothetical protein